MTNQPDHDQPRFGDFGDQAPINQAPPSRLSILALGSFITGFLALPICCVPIGGSLFGLLPVVLGLGGLRAIRKSDGQTAGRSLAIAGFVMGLLATLVSTLAWTAIGGQFAKMPAVYAQVLDEDPAVVRTILTTSLSTEITDEEIARFREGFIAEHGDQWTAPKGIMPIIKAYFAARDPKGLGTVQASSTQSPVPLPIEAQNGWTYLIVVMQQGENLGSRLPALANAAYQMPDGSLVWLVDNSPAASTVDQSPTTDPTDEQSGTPATETETTDPDD